MTRAACRRWILAALVVLAALQVPVGTAAAAHDSPSAGAAAVAGPTSAQAANNTTTAVAHHRDPSDYSESGDVEALKDWLGGRLSARLSESSVNLSQGQYEAARAALGDQYDERLAQYVEVAGETETTRDDQTAREFQAARTEQREYASLTERYRRVHERYEAADNETEARRLARELQTLATRIERQRGNVTDSYTAVANGTGIDVSGGLDAVNRTAANVTSTQSQVRSATFTETRLSLAPASATLSPANETAFSGTVETAAGDPIANGTVVLAADGRTLATATTDAAGAYAVAYRPATLAANTSTLTARYRPASASPYLASNASAAVSVTTRPATVALSAAPATLRYGATSRVAGTVSVAGAPVAGVPVRIAVGDTVVATTRTNASGGFESAPRLGARPASGEATLTVTAGRADTAVTAANASAPVRVRETASDLSVEAAAAGETLTVASRLRADGAPVSGQRVVVSANGTRLSTLTTDADGWANASLALPASVRGAQRVTVRVAYAGGGTNLAASEASTTVPLPASASSGVSLTQAWILLGAFLVAALLFALAYALWRRDFDADGAAEETASEPTEPASPEPTGALSGRLLAQARRQLAADESERAIETAYAAVRRAFDADDPGVRRGTHWEFYRALADALEDEERAALETLTTTYERATFSGERATRSDAEAVVAAADELVER